MSIRRVSRITFLTAVLQVPDPRYVELNLPLADTEVGVARLGTKG